MTAFVCEMFENLHWRDDWTRVSRQSPPRTESVCSVRRVQHSDSQELMVTLTSMQTVERINQAAPKPSSQVTTHTHTRAEKMLSHTLVDTHTLTAGLCLLPQVNLILCVTTSARCFSTCALWTGPAASQVTPARPTVTSLRGGVCSARPLNLRPARCSVGAETRGRWHFTLFELWARVAGSDLTCAVSPAGYDLSRWRETLLRLGQTKVFFSTTATLPYRSESNSLYSTMIIFSVSQSVHQFLN